MEFIRTESPDVRTRVRLRAWSMDGADIVSYEDVDYLPEDAAERIRRLLDEHPIEQYPEGAYIGTIAPPKIESHYIRDPKDILAEPYPQRIELTQFPPKEDTFYKW